MALLLDVDPVGLVRGKREQRTLEQYVNDRPYVASSFLSVAIGQIFRSAMTGKSESHSALAETAIPLEAKISAIPCRGGADFLRKLFEPLGYAVAAQNHQLDEQFPEWGASNYFTVTLNGTLRLRDLLVHLYVLIPVLDNEKHYWVGDDEVEKLLRRGEGWLAAHPEREVIARRYLKNRSSLAREVLSRLMPDEPILSEPPVLAGGLEETLEKPLSLNEQRYEAVIAALKQVEARRIVDVGCGEGKLLRHLLTEKTFTEIVGLDVSHRALEIAAERLKFERMPDLQRERVKLLHGSLTYRDARLEGFDAACVVEVIEHLDATRLTAFEQVLFQYARPKSIIVTTPNAEYNVKFETLPPGKFRHADHRFEWTRIEFQNWANATAEKFKYQTQFSMIGEIDESVGSATQMCVFMMQ